MRYPFENVIFYQYNEFCPLILIVSIFPNFSSKLINFIFPFKSIEAFIYRKDLQCIIQNIFKDNESISRGYSKYFFNDKKSTESKHFHFKSQRERVKKNNQAKDTNSRLLYVCGRPNVQRLYILPFIKQNSTLSQSITMVFVKSCSTRNSLNYIHLM